MSSNRNYNKGNRILKVKVKPSVDALALTEILLDESDTAKRQRYGEQLLDELSDAAKIDVVKLKISDTKQYHKRSGGRVVFKQYGYYRPETNYIYIQNRTAVRGQLLAPKTFLDTLLHEWVHHYDTHKLKLDSIHTKGFYLRLKDLKIKLKLT